MQLILIGVFGAIGVLSRFFIDGFFAQKVDSSFPISTFAINGLGSFLIGLVFTVSQQKNLASQEIILAITVGLLGGFTTFSAYTLQTLQLVQMKQYSMAFAYFLGSPCVGLGFAFLGIWVSGIFIGPK